MSSCGNRPLGVTMSSHAVPASVTKKTIEHPRFVAQADLQRAVVAAQHGVETALERGAPAAPLLAAFGGRFRAAGRILAASIGVSVSDTKAEATIDAVTTTANSLKMRPMIPPIISTGMNTATSETVIEMMVKPISRLPLSAASNALRPSSSMCR